MWPEALLHDIWYAIRRLSREPGFAAIAILILAVGIGACTAMFSIVQAVLLRPFAVNTPNRIVVMLLGHTHDSAVGELAYNHYRDLRARMRSFDDLAIFGSVTWGGTLGEMKKPRDRAR